MSSSSSDDGDYVPNEGHSEARVDDITISDLGSWPLKLTDSLCVSVVKQGPAKPDPVYEYERNQHLLNAETCHWQAVLEGLVAIIQFLGQ
jgi:hypothetical protein